MTVFEILFVGCWYGQEQTDSKGLFISEEVALKHKHNLESKNLETINKHWSEVRYYLIEREVITE